MKHKDDPWLYGSLSILLFYMVLGLIFDLSVSCESGWVSPSIGRQGACSHHGGVNNTAREMALLSSIIFGIMVGIGISADSEPEADSSNSGVSDLRATNEAKHELLKFCIWLGRFAISTFATILALCRSFLNFFNK